MHTELGRLQVKVQRCMLSWALQVDVQQHTLQRAWRLVGKVGKARRQAWALIKSNNPHLAGGEKAVLSGIYILTLSMAFYLAWVLAKTLQASLEYLS